MPIRGAKLKPEARTRVRPTFDWTEVQDVPFTGAPALPFKPSRAVADWWTDVSSMPHCVLWRDSDWRYAIETARLVAKLHRSKGGAGAAEIRSREKVMGTTMDARRDLRIRYVDSTDEPAEITAMDEYLKIVG